MAPLMFTVSTSPLVHAHSNIRNSVFMPRRCFGQIHLHTTPSIRGCSLSIRSTSSPYSGFTRIDGKKEAKSIRDEIKIEVSRMNASKNVVPGLAVILVGERKDSASYVRSKKKACESVGIKSVDVCLPEDSSEEDVLKYILSFNEDPSIHGILVQLPLPSVQYILSMLFIFSSYTNRDTMYMQHLNEHNIVNAICKEKDVDGFHPFNIGLLAKRGSEPDFVPCTPKGCIELLHRYNVEIEGKRAVVIGRSNIVGMPVAHLLQVR